MEQLRRECNQENRECTFHPVISVMSRKLARIPNEFHITRDSRQKCLKKLVRISSRPSASFIALFFHLERDRDVPSDNQQRV